MKNHPFILGICLLAVALSCNKTGPEGSDDKKVQERNAIATVLATLAGQDFDITKDIPFQGKTFEPVYGVVRDDSNPNERSVKVRSAIYSENSFCSLAGGGVGLIEGTSDGLVLDLTGSKFGKLTFHRAPGGANVGYVDVDIPCIPHLEKISYKTNDQIGENAGEESIYKFGEVFKDADGHHYIVVSEVDGSMPGWMVHMAAGRGHDFHYLHDDETWGPWLPNKHYDLSDYGIPSGYADVLDYRVIQDYITLCGDESFNGQKKKIIDATQRKVFPGLSLWTSASVSETEGFEGFATTRPGYNHYIGATEIVGAKIIFRCLDLFPRSEAQYVFFPGDCNHPTYRNYPSGSYAGKASSVMYGVRGDRQAEFEEWFYSEIDEGIRTPGSIAVYTAYCIPFTNENHPGFEKVNY